VLVYIAIYVAMTLGSFAVILTMKRNGQHVEEIGDFAGLFAHQYPLFGVLLLPCLLFSLGGHSRRWRAFFAKFSTCFVAAIKAGLFTLAVIGRARQRGWARFYYYLTIIKGDVFRRTAPPARSNADGITHGAGRLRAFSNIFLLLRLSGGPLVSVATVAAKSLF